MSESRIEQAKSFWPGPAGRWIRSMVSVAVVAAVVAGIGCGDGCPGADDEVDEIQVAADLDDEQLAAVARFSNFNQRHFDAQHWIAEAVEEGVFRDREDLEHGIPEVPTARVREMFGDVLGDEADGVDWDGDVDVAVWRPVGDDEPWRWAAVVDRGEGPSLSQRVDWSTAGRIEVGAGGESTSVPVYERAVDERRGSHWVAEVPTSAVGAETGDGKAWMISNFEQAAGVVGRAVEQTGESGRRGAELYLWPRRLGIADRHAGMGEILDEEMAAGGQDQSPARLGLSRLQAQLQYALGDPDNWPETIRVAKGVDRDEETGAARSVELTVDADSPEEAPWSGLVEAVAGDQGERRARISPEAIQFDGRLDVGAATDLVDAVPPVWWRVLTGRSADELEDPLGALRRSAGEIDGSVTVARFESPVPVGLTGETYLELEASNPEALREAASEWHAWLVEEWWLPLLDLSSDLIELVEPIEVDGDDIELHKEGFYIGHGFGTGGVCHGARETTYVAYYGVRPCEQLVEHVEFDRAGETADSVSYRGRLQGLVDTLYGMPGENARQVYGDIDVDVAIEAIEDETVRLSVEFADLAELGRMLEGTERLAQDWAPRSLVETDGPVGEISMEHPTVQQPGLVVAGPPGFAAPLSGAFVLGMPFSYPPTTPRLYRDHFFGDGDASPGHDHDHGGHSHSH